MADEFWSEPSAEMTEDVRIISPWWYRPIETDEDRIYAAKLLYEPVASRC